MKKTYLHLIFFIGIVLSLQSCISHQSLVSFNEGGPIEFNQPFPIANEKIIRIQANDVLDIKVHSQNIITSAPFNLITASTNSFINNPELLQLNGYLVDHKGFIDFPVLGKINIKDLSIETAKDTLVSKLKAYIKDPVVNIRLLNFKVTVSGEVNRPGSFIIYNDRITLPELFAMAGDLTPYAKRDSILIVREFKGERTYGSVNMNSNSLFESEYYFLQQNDYIYIEPIEAKRGAVADRSNKVLPFVSAVVSVAALLISAFK